MKALLLLIIFSLSMQPIQAETEIPSKSQIKILTPSLAKRETKKIKLDNGLEAILISDPETDKSGALLSVKAGSWDDDDKHPGIAHFLEHLLFLGTEKYPDEGEYHRYIGDHGGQTNAFTANHITSYMFSVDNDSLPGALDRFSYFFKTPLFNASGVARELQAIDQEYAKNLEDDRFREYYVLKELALEDHPYHRFNAGNSLSLANTTREDVRKWYQENYSANLMRLMVISHLPMEQLQPLVKDNFTSIKNKGIQKAPITKRYTNNKYHGSLVTIRPVKDERTLSIVWELPENFVKMPLKKPDSLICHILGHEGEESLFEQLKREGLATKLSCGSLDTSLHHKDLYLEIKLTDKGFHKVHTVIERTFQTINHLKETALPHYLFNEVKQIQTINYQYQKRENLFLYLMKNGFSLHQEPLDTYPIQTKIIQKFDQESFHELLEYLTPQHAIFLLTAPEGTTNATLDRKEKWFQVTYGVEAIDQTLLNSWKKAIAHSNITYPKENPFIPEDLSLTHSDASDDQTILPEVISIGDNEKGKFFYATDREYNEPNIFWNIEIKTPEVKAGIASTVVMADLYSESLKEVLKKYSYPAEIAGLKYQIKTEDNGIGIQISGYNDKAIILLKTIIKAIKDQTFEPALFKKQKETLLRKYQNFAKESPLLQNAEIFKKTIYKYYTTEKEKSVAIKKITQKQFKQFLKDLFNTTYLEVLLYGNLSKSEAVEVKDLLVNTFNSHSYRPEIQQKQKVIDISNEYGPLVLTTHTAALGNSLILAIESLPYSFKKRAAQDILMRGMREPFFSELRTKQQTGYIVFNEGQDVERHLLNLFAVQSNTHDPRDLLSRTELFLESFMQEFQNQALPEERFKKIQEAMVHKLEHPAKNIEEMGSLLNTLAFDHQADFQWIDKRVKATKELTYDQFVNLSKQMVGKRNKKRIGFLMQGQTNGEGMFYNKARSSNQIRRLSTFQGADAQVKE